MKGLLIGLFAFGTISSFANSDVGSESCATQRFLAKGNYIEHNYAKTDRYQLGTEYGIKIGECKISSTWSPETGHEIRLTSNNIILYYAQTSDKEVSKKNKTNAIDELRKSLEDCACSKL